MSRDTRNREAATERQSTGQHRLSLDVRIADERAEFSARCSCGWRKFLDGERKGWATRLREIAAEGQRHEHRVSP